MKSVGDEESRMQQDEMETQIILIIQRVFYKDIFLNDGGG